MKAHFATEIMATSPSADSMEPEASLQSRIEEFKRNSQNMEDMEKFIDDVCMLAELEVDKKLNPKMDKKPPTLKEGKRSTSFAIPDFKNGKVVNRARSMVVRLFDAICSNCANAAPAGLKLRTKRGGSASNASATAASSGEGSPKGESKKQEHSSKDNKKNDKKNEVNLEMMESKIASGGNVKAVEVK